MTLATTFRVRDWAPKNDPLPEHGFLKAWNPSSSTACSEPIGPFDYAIYGRSYCHFKILNAAGDCVLFNNRLDGPTSGGVFDIGLRLIVEEDLSSETITFPEPTDYDSIDLWGYYQEPDFILEQGQTYLLQITEQVAGYNTSRDGELVRFEAQVAVPCCQGMTGNVDGVPQDQVDISDIVALVDYMFYGGPIDCLDEADVNGSGSVDISDLNYLVDYAFNGGPAPVACE